MNLRIDGYKIMSSSELEKFHFETLEIPNRGLAIFPRRAILRIGCLLRDSEVAKLVRSYLLNAEESSEVTHHDRQTLQHLVHQLDRHAGQLIENAEELKGHAQQLQSQSRLIKAIVDEIYHNRGRLDTVETDVKQIQDRIAALEKRSRRSRPAKESDYLSDEQINILKQRVKDKGNPCRVWARLKLHFGVTRYIFLPKEKFREILDWLENYQPE